MFQNNEENKIWHIDVWAEISSVGVIYVLMLFLKITNSFKILLKVSTVFRCDDLANIHSYTL